MRTYSIFLCSLMLFLSLYEMEGQKAIIDHQLIPEVARADFDKIEKKEGAEVYRIGFWNSVISQPVTKEGIKYPLIVALHWAGDENAHIEYYNCQILPLLDSFPAYVIAPNADFDVWYNAFNDIKVRSLMQMMLDRFPIDSTNIIVTGYSNGGNGAFYFAEEYPNYFRASVPIASQYESNHRIQVPLYVIHPQKDELFELKKTRRYAKKAFHKKYKNTFYVAKGKGHFEGCNFVEEIKAAFEWVENLE